MAFPAVQEFARIHVVRENHGEVIVGWRIDCYAPDVRVATDGIFYVIVGFNQRLHELRRIREARRINPWSTRFSI